MTINTIVYSILSSASIAMMFAFVLPVTRKMLPGWELHWYANAITGVLTVALIAPFLRAMVMKKNHSEEWKALWAESNRNRLPLLFTILVRFLIAVSFIFYICNFLSRFTNALMITIGFVVIVLIILSRRTKRRSITLERLFIQNLRSRDIEAQVHGKKRPLYEGKLLDRDIHIADFTVPFNSCWMGQSLAQLKLGTKYGVHVSSILRGGRRINIPDGYNILFPGDVLQVIGSDQQFTAFRDAIENEVLGIDVDVEMREMKLRQLIIGADSPFVGQTLIESRIRDRFSCMVVGLEEGKESLSPYSPNRKFRAGDIIWVVGEQESLDALFNG
jgi:CPA2 family monovalent cation:H+ antiporter-2